MTYLTVAIAAAAVRTDRLRVAISGKWFVWASVAVGCLAAFGIHVVVLGQGHNH